jgi:hypothetical protein
MAYRADTDDVLFLQAVGHKPYALSLTRYVSPFTSYLYNSMVHMPGFV